MLTVLFVTIGLFNLIMAIFVDNVMENKRQHRMAEMASERHIAEGRLRRRVLKCCTEQGLITANSICTLQTNHPNGYSDARFQEKFGECNHIGMTRTSFCHLLSHPELEHLLEDLDIETCNSVELF